MDIVVIIIIIAGSKTRLHEMNSHTTGGKRDPGPRMGAVCLKAHRVVRDQMLASFWCAKAQWEYFPSCK